MCKHGDNFCPDNWFCGKCESEMNKAAYAKLTPQQKAYDNYVDPKGAYHTDYDREPECCSCHICAPCSFCTRDIEVKP